MENVGGIIDALCAKFGVTLEHLIPAIVEFGKYDCQLTARICSYFIIGGILCILFAFLLIKRSGDCEFIGLLLLVIGIAAILIAGFVLLIALATLNKWNQFPEIMAYRYILSLL